MPAILLPLCSSWSGQYVWPVCYLRSSCSSYVCFSLAGFLLFRVLKTGSDTRFDEIRSHLVKFLGMNLYLFSEFSADLYLYVLVRVLDL